MKEFKMVKMVNFKFKMVRMVKIILYQPWRQRSTEDHGAVGERISPRIRIEVGARSFAGNDHPSIKNKLLY